MDKRSAYLIGRNTGNGIAETNFDDFIRKTDDVIEFLKENLYQDDDPVYQFQCMVSHIENESRCFSPFEFTAKEFNESHDPDSMWEEYDRGVWNGAKQTLYRLNKECREGTRKLN